MARRRSFSLSRKKRSQSKRKTSSKRGIKRGIKRHSRNQLRSKAKKTRGGYMEPGWVYDSQYGKWRNTKNGWCKWAPEDNAVVDCNSSMRTWRDGKPV